MATKTKKTVAKRKPAGPKQQVVSVVLCLPWSFLGEFQEEFWKAFNMPCLPAVGTTIWIADDDDVQFGTILNVEKVVWWEDFPETFEVWLTEPVLCKRVTRESFVATMRRLGWTNEGCWFDAR